MKIKFTKKQIIGLMFVGNEDDILEQSIRHNIRYMDHLTVVLDIKSVDGSKEILMSLIAEGLPLDMIVRPGHLNIDFRNEFVEKNIAWAYIFIDDDEFIHGASPELLKKYIFNRENPLCIKIPWKTFVINPREYDCSDLPRSFRYARKFEEPQFYKAIYIRGNSEKPHKILTGAHSVLNLEWIIFNDLFLAHYPVRSYKQLVLKYFASNLDFSLLLRNRTSEDYGWHQKNGFKKITNGEFLSLESLFFESMAFASERKNFTDQDIEQLLLEYNYSKTTNVSNENVVMLISKMIEAVTPFFVDH